ncbi:transcriptional protein SWT1 [Antechinus flavipes]|uniref:transcriptional protein SWT1 n=1 Tax=Antechinus flavipes TaxID=38775 RepID=UPI002236B655|nr:transcriptional protein SWT1 [Antechinus flavipes]XP_051854738.1 transcriptional protein SWT1 [Antechinus flavipes]
MSKKGSNGKQEKSPRKDTSPSSDLDEKEKKQKRISSKAPNPSILSCSRCSTSLGKRKLKSDDTDVLYCDPKRREDLQRLDAETGIQKKKQKISSFSSQEPDRHQKKLCDDSQSTSHSHSLSRTDKEIQKYDFKYEDVKLKSENNRDLKSSNSLTLTKSAQSHVESQTGERKWPHHLSQREKMKGWQKREKSIKVKDNLGKSSLENYSKDEFAKECNSKNLSKETLGPERCRISFKVATKSSSTLQKVVQDNVFNSKFHKSKPSCEKKESLPNPLRHKGKLSPSDSSYKSSDRGGKWREKGHPDQASQKRNDSRPEETFFPATVSLKQNFEATCTSYSNDYDQDTDQEMQIVEELHAARVGKSMDLPVVPASGELTSMEIDLAEDDVHPFVENTASDKKLLIVIDTNILMNHLKFLGILKTMDVPGFDRLVLIIPWVVVQELDRMKAGKLLRHAQHKAIPAVHFINDCLKSQDGKLWGQSIQLASQKFYGLSDENNDDRVLKCCLQYQNLFPCAVVILCTDDRNLCNKSIISGIKSLSKVELSAELLNLSPKSVTVDNQPHVSNQYIKADTKPQEKSCKGNTVSSGMAILLESVISELEKCLGTALSSILETEMKIAFGDLWLEMVYFKPPWTLADLLQCFKKHWLAVFGLVMEKDLLMTIESLYESLCKAKTVDFTTTKFLLQDSKHLIHAFSTRSNYDGVLPQAFAQVNQLLQTLSEVNSKHKPNSTESIESFSKNAACKNQEENALLQPNNQENTTVLRTEVPQPNRHQEIWSVLENVWTTIYTNSTDVFQSLDSNNTSSTPKIASFEEAFVYLQKLMAAVKDVLAGIQRILAPHSCYQDIETLYNFLVSNEANRCINFTAQELYDCVSQAEYREKLKIGCCQLAQMEYTMQQCNASVYMEAKNRGWSEDMLNYRTC